MSTLTITGDQQSENVILSLLKADRVLCCYDLDRVLVVEHHAKLLKTFLENEEVECNAKQLAFKFQTEFGENSRESAAKCQYSGKMAVQQCIRPLSAALIRVNLLAVHSE